MNNRPEIVKTGGRVHGVAQCSTCGWSSENYMTIYDEARRHVKRHGHTVHVEIGLAYKYSPTKEGK